jgi:PTH1 family peptidyl-tRNA hydrolase
LGNPGAEYAGTRHNVGADAVALVASRHGEKLKGGQANALIAEVKQAGKLLALAVPVTYMNDSGLAVRALVRRFGVENLGQLLIVQDELDLPTGKLQVKLGGGLAGHNGLRSIKEHLHSTDFARIRIGIGKPPGGKEKGADHVLKRPGKRERTELEVVVEEAADAIEFILTDGVEAAMTRYNRRSGEQE